MVISGWSSQGVLDCRLQELKLLEEDANVYKLVGPVLVKQDLVEAKANVSKRLEFIRGEIERVEQQLAKLQDKQSKRQQQVGGSLSSLQLAGSKLTAAQALQGGRSRKKQSKCQQQVGMCLSSAACWEQANSWTSTPRRQQKVEIVLTPPVSWEHSQLQDEQAKWHQQVRPYSCHLY